MIDKIKENWEQKSTYPKRRTRNIQYLLQYLAGPLKAVFF